MKKILVALIAVIAVVAVAVPMALAGSAPKATGDVDWAYGAVTGNVTFNAQGTTTDAKGQLQYTDSSGNYLNGVVTCFKQVDAKTAVFSGTITDGSPGYLTPANPYFIAKVVDNGTPGKAGPDQIAVWANAGGTNCAADPIHGTLPTLQAATSSSTSTRNYQFHPGEGRNTRPLTLMQGSRFNPLARSLSKQPSRGTSISNVPLTRSRLRWATGDDARRCTRPDVG